jgi:flagellar basal-body rod protein FlgC
MIDPLQSALKIASSGLSAQSTRMRIVAENLANADSTGSTAGADPYSRKTVTFENALGRASIDGQVRVRSIGIDEKPFRQEYRPGHPAADAQGFVKLPNVDPLIELADMREANRAYQANLQAIRQSRELITLTLDMLKG